MGLYSASTITPETFCKVVSQGALFHRILWIQTPCSAAFAYSVFRPSYVIINTFLFESAWSWLMQEISIQPINPRRSNAVLTLVHLYPHFFLRLAYSSPHMSLAAVASNAGTEGIDVCGSPERPEEAQDDCRKYISS